VGGRKGKERGRGRDKGKGKVLAKEKVRYDSPSRDTYKTAVM